MNPQDDDKLLDGILAGRILVDPRTAAGSEVTRRVVRQLVRRGGISQLGEQQEVEVEQTEELALEEELDCTHIWYEAEHYIACNKCHTHTVAAASGKGVKSHIIVKVDGVYYWTMCGRTISMGDAVFFAEPDVCGTCGRLLRVKEDADG